MTTNSLLDALVRDCTRAGSISKSECKRRIEEIVDIEASDILIKAFDRIDNSLDGLRESADRLLQKL